ncbi:MAG: hypothetical protein N4A36_01620 [Candidatus Gracilibacteria bacterium]|jgi:hypothetical protein|nr:hypothetical protein [Candidatus Gracilibacteria bacterium]
MLEKLRRTKQPQEKVSVFGLRSVSRGAIVALTGVLAGLGIVDKSVDAHERITPDVPISAVRADFMTRFQDMLSPELQARADEARALVEAEQKDVRASQMLMIEAAHALESCEIGEYVEFEGKLYKVSQKNENNSLLLKSNDEMRVIGVDDLYKIKKVSDPREFLNSKKIVSIYSGDTATDMLRRVFPEATWRDWIDRGIGHFVSVETAQVVYDDTSIPNGDYIYVDDNAERDQVLFAMGVDSPVADDRDAVAYGNREDLPEVSDAAQDINLSIRNTVSKEPGLIRTIEANFYSPVDKVDTDRIARDFSDLYKRVSHVDDHRLNPLIEQHFAEIKKVNPELKDPYQVCKARIIAESDGLSDMSKLLDAVKRGDVAAVSKITRYFSGDGGLSLGIGHMQDDFVNSAAKAYEALTGEKIPTYMLSKKEANKVLMDIRIATMADDKAKAMDLVNQLQESDVRFTDYAIDLMVADYLRVIEYLRMIPGLSEDNIAQAAALAYRYGTDNAVRLAKDFAKGDYEGDFAQYLKGRKFYEISLRGMHREFAASKIFDGIDQQAVVAGFDVKSDIDQQKINDDIQIALRPVKIENRIRIAEWIKGRMLGHETVAGTLFRLRDDYVNSNDIKKANVISTMLSELNGKDAIHNNIVRTIFDQQIEQVLNVIPKSRQLAMVEFFKKRQKGGKTVPQILSQHERRFTAKAEQADSLSEKERFLAVARDFAKMRSVV